MHKKKDKQENITVMACDWFVYLHGRSRVTVFLKASVNNSMYSMMDYSYLLILSAAPLVNAVDVIKIEQPPLCKCCKFYNVNWL